MQLTSCRGAGLRQRLGAAACLLLAGSVPAAAQTADDPWQFDGWALLYGEQNRARVVEPTGRITRLFSGGQSLAAEFTADVITGASPTGAGPSGRVQTTTSASGRQVTTGADALPTHPFHDLRGGLDLTWVRPLGARITATTSAHLSQEKDYRSLGGSGQVSVDVMDRLTTLTLGGGFNRDRVEPMGGIAVALGGDSLPRVAGSSPKDVVTGLFGVSRVLSRRWLLGINVSRSRENGYLTDPYKVVSLTDPVTGLPDAQVNERRPATRLRSDVLTGSVVHLDRDVLYLQHRYYWDDWGVRSNTFDVKARHDLTDDSWVQPHVRFYAQTRAKFFVFGLVHGPPLPEYASSDERLGPLRTVTLGATYGFRLPGYPGEFTVRAEFLRQWVSGRPPTPTAPAASPRDAVREFDDEESAGSSPGAHAGTNIGTLLAGYTVRF